MSDTANSSDFSDFELDLVDSLRAVFASRPWLAVGEMAPAAIGLASRICQTAERDPEGFVLALSATAGISDPQSEIPHISLDLPEQAGLLATIRTAAKAFADLPTEVVDQIDRWDPDRTARSILPFTAAASEVADRPSFGAARPHWKALEDKLAVVDVWKTAGIDIAPHAIVDLADHAAVSGAHRRLAGNFGTVWAMDNKAGWHGGADGTFWVSSEADAIDLATERSASNSQARVMPFLEGVPCSIHGMVFDDRTIVFEPCEMMTFLNQDTGRITYGRSATFWRSSCADAMQEAATLVGDELSRRADFRGVFTLDGVATASGFRPTEINPRFGAALPMVMPLSGGGATSLFLVHCCVIESALPGLDPARLQAWVRHNMSTQPEGRLMMVVDNAPPDRSSPASAEFEIVGGLSGDLSDIRVAATGGDQHNDTDETSATASLVWGGRDNGGIVFLQLNPDVVPVGSAVAPLALRLLQAADDRLGLGAPNLLPACRLQ